jgi:hypothetical protein
MQRAKRVVPEPVPAHGEGTSRARAAAATSVAAAAAAAEPGTTRALIWRLQSGGWSSIEAGNLAAIALGLRPARSGWTGPELDRLRFLKSLVIAGRIGR